MDSTAITVDSRVCSAVVYNLDLFRRCTQVGAEAGSTMAADAPSATVAQTEGTEVNDAWTCPICLSWFDMPVAPPCRHSFCSGVRIRVERRGRRELQRVLYNECLR